MHLITARSLRRTAAVLAAAAASLTAASSASAATSAGCEGGGFHVTLPDGQVVAGSTGVRVAAGRLPAGSRVLVQGRYVEFSLDPSTFAVYDYTLTGAANPQDLTGGRRTVLFASKVPDLAGRDLSAGDMDVKVSDATAELRRRGAAAGMKLQLKDCATGGIFQMEADQDTRVTHTLAPGVFYFTNPATGKVNFGDGTMLRGKDSPMAATRLSQSASASSWLVSAGGRMGMVLGEDAVELAAAAPPCVQQCQIQNQIQGSLPVPAGA